MPDRRRNVKIDKLYERPVNTRESKLFVIAIEGMKTEKQYFEKVKNDELVRKNLQIKLLPPIEGQSNEPDGIMQRLRDYKSKNDIQDDDILWLVFDVDHRTRKDISDICAQAKKEKIQCAISDPCFELWLQLHKFTLQELDQRVIEADPKSRPALLKKLCNYQYHSLAAGEFIKDIRIAISNASLSYIKRPFPEFPGTYLGKLMKQLLD